MESVTMAFQGFAKQQYMLLDNLKLGYGGTKTEMERLLKDAQAITGVEYNIDNLADVYTAIGVIQEKLGIAGTTAKEAASTISGAAGMMRASWQNVLVAISGGGDMDAAIENLANSVDIYFDNILPVIEKAIWGIGLVIEKIAPKLAETVGKAFIAEIPRLTTAIYAMIVGAFKGLYQGIIALFKKETNAMLEEQAVKTEETAKSQEKVTDNIKETNKELKKTLAGFDDIQILSSSVAENTSGELDGGLQDIGGDFGGTALDGSAYVNEADETLTAIMGIAGLALAAIGLILLFTGHIGWGVGFIIAGATTLAVTMASASKFGYDGIINMLTTIMGIAGGALLALGIILLWIGGVVGKGVAIGMIIAGGALIVSAVASKAAFSPNDIATWLSLIMGIAGGALLALGVVLCMVGSIPMGVGMIIAGAVSLVSAVALNFDAVVEVIKGPIGTITAIVSAALLVLGIILVCVGVLPLGIGLIAAGAIGLATVVAINWNASIEALRGSIGKITAIVSGALLVLGIILVCTGVGIPLGIALIAAGAASLVTVTALNRNAIVDWVKNAWDAVKKFWMKNIAPVFTTAWWLKLAKSCGNGLIRGFESAINGIIGLFEGMINFVVSGLNLFLKGVDSVISAVGDVFGQDWSVATIPEVKLGRVSIPRLAQGAVIPPNREFLAVLGDQKHGTNIEAPLQTIVDAFNIALSQNGGARGNTEVVLEIDGREFGRAVVEQGDRENRRIGTRLVMI
jgi:hypothetical protein